MLVRASCPFFTSELSDFHFQQFTLTSRSKGQSTKSKKEGKKKSLICSFQRPGPPPEARCSSTPAGGWPRHPGSTCWASLWSWGWRSRRRWVRASWSCTRDSRRCCAGPGGPLGWRGWRWLASEESAPSGATLRSCWSASPSGHLRQWTGDDNTLIRRPTTPRPSKGVRR